MPSRPSLAIQKKVYVAFVIADSKTEVIDVVPVQSRDVSNLDIPAGTLRFHFYDAPAKMSLDETLQHQENPSDIYDVATGKLHHAKR